MNALMRIEDVGAVLDMSLEDMLEAMKWCGSPRLGMYDGGWHCGVEMNTNTTGSTFKVNSEFGHKTPTAAARECLERIRGALKALGAK